MPLPLPLPPPHILAESVHTSGRSPSIAKGRSAAAVPSPNRSRRSSDMAARAASSVGLSSCCGSPPKGGIRSPGEDEEEASSPPIIPPPAAGAGRKVTISDLPRLAARMAPWLPLPPPPPPPPPPPGLPDAHAALILSCLGGEAFPENSAAVSGRRDLPVSVSPPSVGVGWVGVGLSVCSLGEQVLSSCRRVVEKVDASCL